MKIYTRTGDTGETGLFGGDRVRKDHIRIAAYGAVDELNAFLGVSQSLNDLPHLVSLLTRIQNHLFNLGALLATPQKDRLKGMHGIQKEDIIFLEQSIDELEKDLPSLKNFILPGGSPLGASLHVARTVCRRAERDIVALASHEGVEPEMIAYVNRLSDFLFVLARWVNFKKGIPEKLWEKKS